MQALDDVALAIELATILVFTLCITRNGFFRIVEQTPIVTPRVTPIVIDTNSILELLHRPDGDPQIRAHVQVVHDCGFGLGVLIYIPSMVVIVIVVVTCSFVEGVEAIDIGSEPSQAFRTINLPLQGIAFAIVCVLIGVGDDIVAFPIRVGRRVG